MLFLIYLKCNTFIPVIPATYMGETLLGSKKSSHRNLSEQETSYPTLHIFSEHSTCCSFLKVILNLSECPEES